MLTNRLKVTKFATKVGIIALWLGPFATVMSILAVHIANVVSRPEAYVEAPPSISRAIVHNEIGELFAIAMIPTAFFILLGVAMLLLAYWKLLSHSRLAKFFLVGIFCAEFIAAIGMITLSQYRTEEWQFQHDLGSYVLFTGHAIAITLAGIMISKFKVTIVPNANNTLLWVPSAARTVFILSVLYGGLYFGRQWLPDEVFFWQRLILAVSECALLTVFVSFLWRHTEFVKLMTKEPELIPSEKSVALKHQFQTFE